VCFKSCTGWFIGWGLVQIVALGTACKVPPKTSPSATPTSSIPFADGFRLDSPGTAAPDGPSAVQVVYLIFDVVRADLPVSSVRHSRKIWNHVDELRFDAEVSASLNRNGLRCGVMSPGSLPAIMAILESAHAKTQKSQVVAPPGTPVTVLIGEVAGPESVFAYSRTRTLVGKTFPAGNKVLTLDYEYHPELGGATDLRVRFEVRHDLGTMTLERTEDTLIHVPAVDRYGFEEPVIEMTLRTTDWLLIGPGEKVEIPNLLGPRFFTWSESGSTQHETLLFIMPRPHNPRESARKPS